MTPGDSDLGLFLTGVVTVPSHKPPIDLHWSVSVSAPLDTEAETTSRSSISPFL